MKKLFLIALLFLLQGSIARIQAQDNYAVEFNLGLLHNNSLFLGEALNTGGSVGLNYFFDRNIFAGFNGTYLAASNPVNFQPFAFNANLYFKGSPLEITENINRMQMGAVAGYRFFPLRYVSISIGLQLNYLSLSRSYKDSLPVTSAAVNWLDQSYPSNSVITPGAFLNFAFNVGRKTSLFLGVQSSDITNSLFEAKDAALVESISLADGHIVNVVERENIYNPLDIRLGVIFKFANRKF
jgi:hypothetical protein